MKDLRPHVLVLGLIKESGIGMGRALLASVLRGERDDRTQKLRLDKLVHFGSLPLYDAKDIFEILDLMQSRNLIELKGLPTNNFIKVLCITKKGEEELNRQEMDIRPGKGYDGQYSKIDKVDESDRKLFDGLGDILAGFSDEQKKAIVSNDSQILCIAGAGSGKTKVLTKRAWYLAALRSVEQSKILAITFTRKARQEMISRLSDLMPNNRIEIETFNSFCENFLKKNEKEIYGKNFTVMDYSSKVKLVLKILSEINLDVDTLMNAYYSSRKLQSHDKKLLFLGFVNDIFSLMDYQRNNNLSDEKLNQSLIDYPNIRSIIEKINLYKQQNCMRDYTDQIVHVLEFFRENRQKMPRFEHILVDEYQDINCLQFELIDLLAPDNLFAVGDPRQSIYGWRGSKIEYILDFEKNYPGSKILQLSNNYRSTKNIVQVCNRIISPLKLPELITGSEKGEEVKFVKHNDEDAENLFVVQSILSSDCPRNSIFVLARTNKQLEPVSDLMNNYGIKFIKRTVENMKQNIIPAEDEVTLSTIHAIKGLEADRVYLIGANTKNHPCKTSEHPILEVVKSDDTYDKNSEELRLVYVAASRAKKNLILSYTGTLCAYFSPGDKLAKPANVPAAKYKTNNPSMLYEELRAFRSEESSRLGIPPYQVFNDRTLSEICDALPETQDDLMEISGLGPYKLRKWGNKIINIVRSSSS